MKTIKVKQYINYIIIILFLIYCLNYFLLGDDENNSGDGGEEGDEGDIKQEYVKKVYVAK
jgi:hypothetical protein